MLVALWVGVLDLAQFVGEDSIEHTPKNVLLRAVRSPATAETQSAAQQRYDSLKSDLAMTTWHLERALSR